MVSGRLLSASMDRMKKVQVILDYPANGGTEGAMGESYSFLLSSARENEKTKTEISVKISKLPVHWITWYIHLIEILKRATLSLHRIKLISLLM